MGVYLVFLSFFLKHGTRYPNLLVHICCLLVWQDYSTRTTSLVYFSVRLSVVRVADITLFCYISTNIGWICLIKTNIITTRWILILFLACFSHPHSCHSALYAKKMAARSFKLLRKELTQITLRIFNPCFYCNTKAALNFWCDCISQDHIQITTIFITFLKNDFGKKW